MSWFNAIVHGVLLGGVYALLATGLSLMFGVMRIINLAHGSLALIGAYMAFLLVEHTGISPYLALAPVLPGALVSGYILQRTLLERSLRAGPLVPLLTTFGLLIVIGNLLLKAFSPDVRSLDPGSLGSKSWNVTSSLSISAFEALTLGVAIVVLGGLQLFLSRTRMGRELDTSLFIQNGPSMAGLGSGGEGYLSFSIATPTGEGVTTPLTFTRQRRSTTAGSMRVL